MQFRGRFRTYIPWRRPRPRGKLWTILAVGAWQWNRARCRRVLLSFAADELARAGGGDLGPRHIAVKKKSPSGHIAAKFADVSLRAQAGPI
jgi:hypothetical protein